MNLYYLSNSAFFGFAIYSLVFIICKYFSFYKKNIAFSKIDQAAISVVIVAGVVYASVWIYDLETILLHDNPSKRDRLLNRMTGIYAFGFWLQPLSYILFSQLMRIKKIANHSVLRFIAAFFLFLNFEKLVIFITSFHRDYLPSSWDMYDDYSIFGWIIADWIIKLVIFASMVVVAFLIKNRKTL